MKKIWLIGFLLTIAFVFLIGIIFSWPATEFRWKATKWESQIKQKQNTETLRVWAKELLVRYKDNADDYHSIQTNKPPLEVSIRGYRENTIIYYAEEGTNGQVKLNPAQDYVMIEWGGGTWVGACGLKIGETNFICNDPDMWKPGIYFFRFSGG